MSQVTSEFEVAPAPPQANHVSAPPTVVVQLQDHKAPGGGPRASKRTQWIRLADAEDHEYYEYQVLAQTNYPNEFNTRYFVGRGAVGIIEGLKRITFEHNGWVDAEGEVLPAIDQPCRRAAAIAEAFAAEQTTYAIALKEARTENAKLIAEGTHIQAERKLTDDVNRQQDELPGKCCFWDAISQDEVYLMIRAITEARDTKINFLLEKRISSAST